MGLTVYSQPISHAWPVRIYFRFAAVIMVGIVQVC